MLSPRPSPEDPAPKEPEISFFQETQNSVVKAKISGAARSEPRQKEEYFVDALVAHGSTRNEAWNFLRLADRWNLEVRSTRDLALRGLFECAEARHHGSSFLLPGGGFGGDARREKKGSEKQRQERFSSQLFGH